MKIPSLSTRGTPARRVHRIVLAGLVVALTSACSVEESKDDELTVGVVNSYTGPLAIFGPSWEDGFRVAIDEATGGSNEVDGVKIKIEVRDDKSDPATGLLAAKELLGDGAPVIAGTSSSAAVAQIATMVRDNDKVFLGGNTAAPELSALGEGIFRTMADTPVFNNGVLSLVEKNQGTKIAIIAQDYAFGQASAQTLASQATERGMEVVPTLLPVSTQDFTAGIAKAVSGGVDHLYVSWVGEEVSQLYQALADRGLFADDSEIEVIGIAPNPVAFETLASAVGAENLANLHLLGYYAPGSTDNAADRALMENADPDVPIDSMQASGYLAGLMLVRAIEENGTDLSPAKVNEALAGQTFEAPQGDVTIRAEDHLTLASLFEYRLASEDGELRLALEHTFPADEVVYPVAKKIS